MKPFLSLDWVGRWSGVNRILTCLCRDDLSHANEDIFSKEETLDTIRNISQELASIGVPVYPSLGNHDIVPKNQFPTPDSWTEYYGLVSDIWSNTFTNNPDGHIWLDFEENGI